MRAWVLFLVFSAAIVSAQTNDAGKQVYSAAEGSVFLVYLNNSSGATEALGSAFLIEPHVLVTNAHVADAGTPVLAVGPVRLPLKVLRVDRVHDLATMSVDADLTSTPLVLSSEQVKPGEEIFAIGNPEGLEKSISQGIVAGLRKRDGNDLIQITSPISHGSSGGPVLNSKGEVIGVAVAFLKDGQNLNFAVPSAYVKELLAAKEVASSVDPAEALARIEELFKQQGEMTYSAEENSDYQKLEREVVQLVNQITDSTQNPAILEKVACLGVRDWDILDSGIKAARKLLKTKPTSESQALLSYMLYFNGSRLDLNASFSKDGSQEKQDALTARDKFLKEANSIAGKAAQTAHGNTLLLADYVLGSSNNSLGDFQAAAQYHSKVAGEEFTVCNQDLGKQSLQNLVSDYAALKKPDEAERWFRKYASKYQPQAYEWDSEGDRRDSAGDRAGAAAAYEAAAGSSPYYLYDYCYAAGEYYLQSPEDADGVLRAGKQCVEAAAKNTNKTAEPHFKDRLPYVYEFMADILNRRGVYDTALAVFNLHRTAACASHPACSEVLTQGCR